MLSRLLRCEVRRCVGIRIDPGQLLLPFPDIAIDIIRDLLRQKGDAQHHPDQHDKPCLLQQSGLLRTSQHQQCEDRKTSHVERGGKERVLSRPDEQSKRRKYANQGEEKREVQEAVAFQVLQWRDGR